MFFKVNHFVREKTEYIESNNRKLYHLFEREKIIFHSIEKDQDCTQWFDFK